MTNFCRIIIHFIIEYFHRRYIYILFDKSKYNIKFIQYIEIKNGVNIILR